jgi:TRAP-type C4-dicarboxylate transport system permease small subunit
MANEGGGGAGGALISVPDDEPDAPLAFHAEDVLSFVIFWGMALIVFLQFFTRYVLNDSFAWTEEIARYLLMIVTFVGAAIAVRRGTHISIELAHHFLPPRMVRLLNFIVDLLLVGFTGLLLWFAISIADRMQIQTMTVLPLSMSYVYGAIGVGCAFMLWRAVQNFGRGWRRGWHPDPAKAMDEGIGS